MTTNFDIHELFPKCKTISNHRDITVYHGSQKWFEEFNFEKLGLYTPNDLISKLGFHFTENQIEKNGREKRYDFIALTPDTIEVDLNRIER